MAAGIYIHIPFCKSRCSYCDFATDIYRDADAVERYVAAVCREIEEFSPQINADETIHTDLRYPRPSAAKLFADTVYFGGGTPSLLRPDRIGRILQAVRDTFDIADNAEITMEMNPATVTPDSLEGYLNLGVNRASFGVQTFDDRALKLLARGHDAADARQTFAMLREAGFDNVSFDLIAGLPGQKMDEWRRNLAEAIALSPEHLSLYLLEVHGGTSLAQQIKSGRRPLPDDDEAAEMYEMMLDTLAAEGYEQYEISNFARPGRESRHNNKYWELEPVFGFGVSAHSFDGTERYANRRDTPGYVEAIESNGTAENFREATDVASEYVFLGLRLESGIDLADYRERFGNDLATIKADSIERLTERGLVELSSDKLRLTRRGKLFSNEVFAEFV